MKSATAKPIFPPTPENLQELQSLMEKENTALLLVPGGRSAEGDFSVPVIMKQIRGAYGRIDVQVIPIGGQGSRWVRLAMLKIKGMSVS